MTLVWVAGDVTTADPYEVETDPSEPVAARPDYTERFLRIRPGAKKAITSPPSLQE
jgi:hypothetical protein